MLHRSSFLGTKEESGERGIKMDYNTMSWILGFVTGMSASLVIILLMLADIMFKTKLKEHEE